MDNEIVETAKQIGLNLSQFCENSLKEAIIALKDSNLVSSDKRRFLDKASFVKKVLWRGVWDLNPRGPKDHRLSRPASYQARATPQWQPYLVFLWRILG